MSQWARVNSWAGDYEVSSSGIIRNSETKTILAGEPVYNVEIRQINLRPGFIIYISASGTYCSPFTFGKWVIGRVDEESGYLVETFPYDLEGNLVEMGVVIPIHRLMVHAFYGPTPEIISVRHVDGNKMDNSLANLTFE